MTPDASLLGLLGALDHLFGSDSDLPQVASADDELGERCQRSAPWIGVEQTKLVRHDRRVRSARAIHDLHWARARPVPAKQGPFAGRSSAHRIVQARLELDGSPHSVERSPGRARYAPPHLTAAI